MTTRPFIPVPKYWAMCKGLRTYDPRSVRIFFAGVELSPEGYADGEKFTTKATK